MGAGGGGAVEGLGGEESVVWMKKSVACCRFFTDHKNNDEKTVWGGDTELQQKPRIGFCTLPYHTVLYQMTILDCDTRTTKPSVAYCTIPGTP